MVNDLTPMMLNACYNCILCLGLQNSEIVIGNERMCKSQCCENKCECVHLRVINCEWTAIVCVSKTCKTVEIVNEYTGSNK